MSDLVDTEQPDEQTVEDELISALFSKQDGERDRLIRMGIIEPEHEPSSEQEGGFIDFDGGVRQTAPAPSDPLADNAALMAEFLALPRQPDGFYEDPP